MQVAAKRDINITPLIDIVLVLLIVSIVIMPAMAKHQPHIAPLGGVPGTHVPVAMPLLEQDATGLRLDGAITTPEAAAVAIAARLDALPEKEHRVRIRTSGDLPLSAHTDLVDALHARDQHIRVVSQVMQPPQGL